MVGGRKAGMPRVNPPIPFPSCVITLESRFIMATPHKTSARPKSSPAKTPRPAAPRKPRTKTSRSTGVSPEQRHQMIAEAAYLRAERRGFSLGDPLDDWLAAEQEIDTLLSENAAPVTQQ